MGQPLAEKILVEHLVDGTFETGEEIGIEIDQVLSHDTTGTMVWLQFEALDMDSIQTDLASQHCDHQTFQHNFRNTDDHRFLRSASGKFGAHFSKAGNGVCHQVHKENFAKPGTTLLGADSHTQTQGGLGQIAIGSGGLDIAVALGGGAYYLEAPEIVNVHLEGELSDWVTAKDVALELLRRYSVKYGVNKIFEFTGPGISNLTVPERCTITNMCTELGATTSVFPSDENTLDFLTRLNREEDYVELNPDENANYDDRITLDLSGIEPLIAMPSMPDKIVPVRKVSGTDVDQVIIGSCTNGAFEDILPAAKILEDQEVHPATDMVVVPASKRAGEMLTRQGWTAEMMAAGVNFSEATCGPCVGIGHVPATDSVSLRTFNRNFEGRSGNEDDAVYLCSPEVAATAAIAGEIVDPRDMAERLQINAPVVELPEEYVDANKSDLIPPDQQEVDRLAKGPNIGDVPLKEPLEPNIRGEALLKMGDNISTDHIMPATSDIVIYRSNIPKLSKFTLSRVDSTFAERALDADGGVLVAGENYGQGSSREHAALCPMYLGIETVLARSFARIHKTNLFNFGIVPLVIDEAAYERIDQGDDIEIVDDVADAIAAGIEEFTVLVNDEWETTAELRASERERDILVAGGKLPHTKQQSNESSAATADD